MEISFEIINEKICLLLNMLLFSESHKLPDLKIWEKNPKTFVQARSDSMIQCLVICSNIFCRMSFVRKSNLINKINSGSSFP